MLNRFRNDISKLSISELIQKCINNEEKAQFELYNRYKATFMQLTRRYVSAIDQVDDVYQEAFIKIFKSIHLLQNNDAFIPWAKKIFIRTALNIQKSNKAYLYEEVIDQCIEEPAEDFYHPSISMDEIAKAISDLSYSQRTVFNMYVIDEMSHDEISTLLEISESYSRVLLTRARRQLRNNLLECGEIVLKPTQTS